MRIGIVTKWFNSGQAVVSRYVRSALDELGHETYVLARAGKGPRQAADEEASIGTVWDQPGITRASDAEVPLAEYEGWIDELGLEAIHWDNDYDFDAVAAIRRRGVRTFGRFVWEHFAPEHAKPAREAYDAVYSLTRAEQERYRELGLDTPYVLWGVHPELLRVQHATDRAAPGREVEEAAGSDGVIRFLLPGSFLGKRKPLAETLEAFSRTRNPRFRLLLKAQVKRREGMLAEASERDPRIEILLEDQPTDEHLRLVAGCDVCLNPTRWEGLGLPLFEALAFGQPAITNDNPPMNEVVRDGVNGLLVGARADGTARSGILAYTPDSDELAAAIERLGDDELRSRLGEGARRMRDDERSWRHTVDGLRGLVEALG